MVTSLNAEAAKWMAEQKLASVRPPDEDWRIVDVVEYPWGWAVKWTSAAEESDEVLHHAIEGHGPIVVDRDACLAWFIGSFRTLADYVPRFERRRLKQRELRGAVDLEYLGNGPAATGAGGGWAMDRDLCFRRTECAYLMMGDPFAYDECYCGALHRDVDAARFGSRLGDDGIEVYRARPTNRSRIQIVSTGNDPGPPGSDEATYVDPWVDLRGGGSAEADGRRRLEAELAREVSSGHPLHRANVVAEARCTARDDVVFRLSDGRWALVHLTWSADEAPPWPATVIFETADALQEELAFRDG